jgi:lysophospholipid acyltransferase (LPLAT)-like uncharacterized protein
MPAADRPIPKPAGSGIVVPNQPRWFERLGAAALVLLIRLVAATLRWRLADHTGRFSSGEARTQVIFAIWHNRLALVMPIYRRYVWFRPNARQLAALVSASRDGGLLACGLEMFGVRPVRGSTSRRGRQALLELVSAAEDGCHLAITPDGPRGPCYVVQPGVVALAQVTGLPIVPATCFLQWKRSLKSWDRFQVPLPFSRCEVEIGELIHVPRDASDEERERLRKLLEDRLRAMTRD